MHRLRDLYNHLTCEVEYHRLPKSEVEESYSEWLTRHDLDEVDDDENGPDELPELDILSHTDES